ncbi:MAG: hypothetical protein KDK37_18800 [Leptospiraceae bacterium]|nr:hypothetical protein [Leptospiraceae bacterium]
MKILKSVFYGLSPLVLVFALQCGGSNAAGGDPKVGDTCKDLGPMDARIACSDNNIIFCSSYSDYKYKLQRECDEGTTCKVGADGKSASCQ